LYGHSHEFGYRPLEILEPLAATRVGYDDLLSEAGPESREVADIASVPLLGDEAISQAADQLVLCLDYLEAWQALLLDRFSGIPIYAHIALIRGSMEASVTVLWLLDPECSPAERAGRAVAMMVHDLEEQRKAEQVVEELFDWPESSADKRLADLESSRASADVPEVRWPGPTRLFATHGMPNGPRGEAIYRVLSAHAHGRFWRLLLYSDQSLSIVHRPDSPTVVEVEADDDVAMRMTQLAMDWVSAAVEEAREYHGLSRMWAI
jgi:hypothetical protein